MTASESWTRRDENNACCENSPGPVGNAEIIARLVHSRIVEPDHEPFKRSELFPPKKGGFTNTCGEADGVSVVRRDTLSDDDLHERSRLQAERKPGREARGALIANVQQLRELKRPSSTSQIAFVYDDPLPDDNLHAVLRGCETIDRVDQDEARDLIRNAFNDLTSKGE